MYKIEYAEDERGKINKLLVTYDATVIALSQAEIEELLEVGSTMKEWGINYRCIERILNTARNNTE